MSRRSTPYERVGVVSDIDETLLNSVQRHHRELSALAQAKGEEDIPTYEELLAKGGTHKTYTRFDWYLAANEQMRNSPDFNTGLNPMPGARRGLGAAQSLLREYLTTRPEQLSVVTHADLIAQGFPDREVVARPDSVPLSETTAWKIQHLVEKAEATQEHLYMIDDSAGLYEAIIKLAHPLIHAILFNGPLTNHPEAKNWREILRLLYVYAPTTT